jgi:hypothetical protein
METNRLNFFDDLREKLILVAVGLLSMTTLVPLFFNQMSRVFGVGIKTSYNVFVFLYFIFPVVFYILYCSIHDHIGFLKLLPKRIYDKFSKAIWIGVECIFLITCCWALLTYNGFASWIFVIIIGVLVAQLFRIYLKARPFYPVEDGVWKEFLVLSSVTLALFSVLFYLNFSKIKESFRSDGLTAEKARHSFQYYGYKDTLKKYLQDPVDTFVEESHRALLGALIKKPNEGEFQTTALPNNIIDSLGKMEDLVSTACADSCWSLPMAKTPGSFNDLIRYILRSKSTGPTQYKTYESALFLQLYVQKMIDIKRDGIKDAWAARLGNLQWKGLAWLLFLIIASLCLWLFMMNELAAKSNAEIRRSSRYKGKHGKATQALNDNVDQIKGFTYICILLVVPFFKPIDKSEVALDRPFLNFGVEALLGRETVLQDGKRGAEGNDLLSSLDRIRELLKVMSAQQNSIERKVDSSSMRSDSIASNTIHNPDGLAGYRKAFLKDSINR